MTENETLKLIAFAMSCYPAYQDKDPEPIANAWKVMLADIPYPLAQKAIMKHVASSKFFPSVAEIRENVFASRNALPTAEEAWAEVRPKLNGNNLIGFRYRSESPTWSNEIISQTVQCIGFEEMCESENLDFTRAHFVKFYNSFRSRAAEKQSEEMVLRLTEGKGLNYRLEG